jgi:hypothetical protein
MWLLDVNMPKQLGALLGEYGIEAKAADDSGWGGLTNGALVEAANHAGFCVVLTRDRLFSESAARALRRFAEFCVVLVTSKRLFEEKMWNRASALSHLADHRHSSRRRSSDEKTNSDYS